MACIVQGLYIYARRHTKSYTLFQQVIKSCFLRTFQRFCRLSTRTVYRTSSFFRAEVPPLALPQAARWQKRDLRVDVRVGFRWVVLSCVGMRWWSVRSDGNL